jgi:hypothetical protein
MIIEQENRSVRMNGLGESKAFGIREQDMAFVTGILTDKLYSDKELAIIREYICNAIDANNDNNSKKKILITPPSVFDQTYKVRDYGKGLSYQDVTETYISLGLSTKRNTNKMIGAFGIGCKSAFAYTDSFNITSWFEGKRYTYTAQKDETGKLVLIPIATIDSDEPSGIEIAISIHNDDIKGFNSKLSTFCKYLDPIPDFVGEFKVDAPEKLIETENFFILKNDNDRYNYTSSVYAFMGNVAYPIDIYQLKDNKSSINYLRDCYIKFDLGEVSISPDREKLEYTEETKQAILNKIDLIKDEIVSSTQKQIDSCSNILEVFPIIKEVRNSFNLDSNDLRVSKFSFKGKTIENKHVPIFGYTIKKSWRNSNEKYYSSKWNINVSMLSEKSVLIKANSDSRIIPARFSKGYEEKFGFKPDWIIVSDRQEVFDGLMLDDWDQNQIVTDYKSFWAKVEKTKSTTPSRVLIYHNGDYAYDLKGLSNYNEIPYVVTQGSNRQCQDPTDQIYRDSCKNLGFDYFTVPSTKVKHIESDSRCIPIKKYFNRELKKKLDQFDLDYFYIENKIKENESLFDLPALRSFIHDNKEELISNNENSFVDNVDYIDQFYLKSDRNNYSLNRIIDVAKKHQVNIPETSNNKIKTAIENIISTSQKYALAVKVYNYSAWQVSNMKKEIKEFISMVNRLDINPTIG